MKSRISKEFDRRHIREENKQKKIVENYFRAVLSLVPGLNESLYAIEDAERAQIIEDNFEIIFEKIRDLKSLSLSENYSVVKDEIESLKQEREEILQPLLKTILDLKNLPEEISAIIKKNSEIAKDEIITAINDNRKLIQNDLKNVAEEFKEELKAQFLQDRNEKNTYQQVDNKASSKDDLIVALGNKLVNNIDLSLERGEFSSALKIVGGIIDNGSFKFLDTEIKTDLLAIKGDILFKQGKKEQTKKIVVKLIKNNIYTKRKFDFLFFYSSVMQNKRLYIKIKKQFAESGGSENSLLLKELYFQLVKGNSDFVIKKISVKNQIIDKYKNSKDALYYLGLAFLTKNDFEFAKNAFIASNEIKSSTYLSYLITICEARSILSKGSVLLINSKEKELLKGYYKKITEPEIVKYFAERDALVKGDYYLNRINILLIINPKDALNEYNMLPKNIKKQTNIKLLYADILIFEKKYDESLVVLVELSKKHKNPKIIFNILNLLMVKKLPLKILEFADSLDQNDFDKDGNISSIIIDAIYQTSGFKAANQKADIFLGQQESSFLLYYTLSKIYFAEGKINESEDWMLKCSNSIIKDNNPLRYIIAEDCFSYNFLGLAISILKPLITYDLKAKIRYLEITLKSNDENLVNESNNILNTELRKFPDNISLLKLKADAEYHLGNKKTSLDILDKIFDMQQMPDVAYNIVGLKADLNIPDFTKYSKVLEKEMDARYLMLAAYCYFLDGDHPKAQSLSYYALSKHDNSFDEIIYSQYLQMILMPSINMQEKVDFNRIEVNTSFELIREGESLWITIDSNNSLFEIESKLEFAGSIHLKSDDIKSLRLIDKKINDTVEYQNVEFTINQIISNKTRAFRYCLSEYTSNVPNSTFMKEVIVDVNDPITSILPHLFELEKTKDEIFKDYNLRNKVGVPLNIMSKHFGNNLLDAILHIFSKKNQPFYAGEVNLFNLYQEKIVITASTIVLLKILNRLETLMKYKDIVYITKSTIDYFISVIKEIDKFEKNTKLSIGIHDNNPIFQEMSSDDISNRRQFFLDILSTIEKFEISEISYGSEEYDSNERLISLVGLNEFESIKLATEMKAIYVSDDLVTRKYNNMTRNSFSSTNVVAVLEHIHENNIEEFLNDLIKLLKSDYLYSFNSTLLVKIIMQISENFKIVGPSTVYNLLSNLISNSLNSKICFQNNEIVLLEVINILYEERLTNNIEYCIKMILTKLDLHYQVHIVEHVILLGKLRALSRSNDVKFAYFKKLLG